MQMTLEQGQVWRYQGDVRGTPENRTIVWLFSRANQEHPSHSTRNGRSGYGILARSPLQNYHRIQRHLRDIVGSRSSCKEYVKDKILIKDSTLACSHLIWALQGQEAFNHSKHGENRMAVIQECNKQKVEEYKSTFKEISQKWDIWKKRTITRGKETGT
jgi:hypothetical protein